MTDNDGGLLPAYVSSYNEGFTHGAIFTIVGIVASYLVYKFMVKPRFGTTIRSPITMG